MIKVGLDLHGVITDDPDFFRKKMEYLMDKNGYEVWVISGPPDYQVKAELETLGIFEGEHFTGIVGVVDHLIDEGHEYRLDEAGNYWFDEETWWKSKSEICTKHNISYLLDNDVRYGVHFNKEHPTKFKLYK